MPSAAAFGLSEYRFDYSDLGGFRRDGKGAVDSRRRGKFLPNRKIPLKQERKVKSEK
jgi:hypothetical protein